LSEPAGRLERVVRSGVFCVTAEIVPPRSADGGSVFSQARELVGYADAVNVTDNPAASAHMSPLAGVAGAARAGIEPTMQLTVRDRNRLALTSDLLGGWALGARNVLCLSGDPISSGDHPDAAEVRDLGVLDLVRLATGLRDRGQLASGAEIDPSPRYLVGVADSPLVRAYDPGRLEAKLDAGAAFVQTQIVYDVDAFAAWTEVVRARGIHERAALIAGVAALRSVGQARYVNDRLPGVVVPVDVVRALESAGPDAAEVGVEIAVDVVRALAATEGISGVHVMGIGREASVRHVVERAGLLPRPAAP
jgi:methylenetetrahydrofolate reductase (NADPH)